MALPGPPGKPCPIRPFAHGGFAGEVSRKPQPIWRPNEGRYGGGGSNDAAAVQPGAATLSLAPWLPNQECTDNNLCRGQSFADGVFGKLGNAPDLQFNHDLLAMGFYGFDADV